jgi:hypothetical protein
MGSRWLEVGCAFRAEYAKSTLQARMYLKELPRMILQRLAMSICIFCAYIVENQHIYHRQFSNVSTSKHSSS